MARYNKIACFGIATFLAQTSCVTNPSIESSLSTLPNESNLNAVGKELYAKNCSSCHSSIGDGKGESAMYLKDTVPSFQTQTFNKKSVTDIAKIIAQGVKGSSMEAYGSEFNQEQLTYLSQYVKTLGQSKGSH